MPDMLDISLTEQQIRLYEEMYQGLATKKPLNVSDLTAPEKTKLAGRVERENKKIEKEELAAEKLKAKQDAIKLKELQEQDSLISEDDVPTFNQEQYINLMDIYFTSWAYITRQNVFMNFNTGEMMNKEGFSDLFGHVDFPLKNKVVKGDVKLDIAKNAADSFNKNQFKSYPKVYSAGLDSDFKCGDVMTKGGIKTINAWNGIEIKPVQHDNDAVDMFLDLLHKIIHENDINNLLQWMARLIQAPTKKILWSPIIVGTKGNGKTTLAIVLSKIIGSRYTKVIDKDTLKDSFNGWVNSKCLAVIEEIRVGGDFAVIDKLKQYVTNETIPMRGMRADSIDVDNHCDLIICSNHVDAVKIENDERRWYPIMTNQRPGENEAVEETFGPNRGAEYFKKFYRDVVRNKESLESICYFLSNYSLDNFNAGTAPTSHHKDEFIQRTMSSNAIIIQDLIEDQALDVKGVIIKRSIDDVAKSFGIRMPGPRPYGMAMEELGYEHLGRVNIYGGDIKTQIYAKRSITKNFENPGAAWQHYKEYSTVKNTYVHDIQENPFIISKS